MLASISRAKLKDLSSIQKYIRNVWAEDHILSKSSELFKWQYQVPGTDEFNFVIAREDNEIIGILGFTNNSQYSQSLPIDNVNWLSMWKVSQSVSPGLGLKLLRYVESEFESSGTGTIGCNINAKRIYRSLGYKTGVLSHFYIPNPSINDLEAQIYRFDILNLSNSDTQPSNFNFVKILDEKQQEKLIEKCLKDHPLIGQVKKTDYFMNRYLHHPFYRYMLHSIENYESLISGFIISRIVNTGKGNVLRVLEIVGQDKNLMNPMTNLLKSLDCQFADFYMSQTPEDNSINYGFHLVEEDMNLPTLFEPLSYEKSLFHYALKMKNEGKLRISRGDCDQDRPNRL